jgi:hypothetical protein
MDDMGNCVPESKLNKLAETTLSRFNDAVEALPKEASSEFFVEARNLRTELLTIYRLVAICARDEDDLDKVASLWSAMVLICDKFAERLSQLNSDHPDCGAEVFYDQILDLRNKCLRLQKLHA